MACFALARLAQFEPEKAWQGQAKTALLAGMQRYEQSPAGSPMALMTLDLLTRPSPRVELHGKDSGALHKVLSQGYRPFIALTRGPSEGSSQAVVCLGTQCLEPATTPAELKERLKAAYREAASSTRPSKN